MTPEKLCIFCKHFTFAKTDYYFISEETGGELVGGLSCEKRHYTERQPNDLDELRAIYLKAESCSDYCASKGDAP